MDDVTDCHTCAANPELPPCHVQLYLQHVVWTFYNMHKVLGAFWRDGWVRMHALWVTSKKNTERSGYTRGRTEKNKNKQIFFVFICGRDVTSRTI